MSAAAIASLLLASGTLLLPAYGLAGQAPGDGGATISGMVYDSTAQRPLPHARIHLWGTSRADTADAEGRFSFESLPAGEYSIVFFHSRLTGLGISAGPRTVTVSDGEAVRIDLATPSLLTVLASQCALEPPGPGEGVAVGWVGDTETGVPMPGARVRFAWPSPADGEPQALGAVTDDHGWYRACGLPTGVPVQAEARFLDRTGTRREVELEPRGRVRLDFRLDELEPAVVRGILEDAETGAAVEDAVVHLTGTGYRAVSDGSGRFTLESVPPGTYTIEISHLAYGTRRDSLHVGSGLDLRLSASLATRPIELGPITVEVETPLDVTNSMGGHRISRADVDRVRDRSRDVGDLLEAQRVSGLLVSRDASNTCVEYLPGQVRMFKRTCENVMVYVDNVKMADAQSAMALPASIVDRMVLFRPVEAGNLFGVGAGSGVLLIFTRSGAVRH